MLVMVIRLRQLTRFGWAKVAFSVRETGGSPNPRPRASSAILAHRVAPMLETPVFSTAAVAAPHRRAAEIGQSILASGGNAVEAVVAMAATCAVVLPHLNGLGGDGFFLVREPRGRVHALDASGPAGTLATIERYRKREYEGIPASWPGRRPHGRGGRRQAGRWPSISPAPSADNCLSTC